MLKEVKPSLHPGCFPLPWKLPSWEKVLIERRERQRQQIPKINNSIIDR